MVFLTEKKQIIFCEGETSANLVTQILVSGDILIWNLEPFILILANSFDIKILSDILWYSQLV